MGNYIGVVRVRTSHSQAGVNRVYEVTQQSVGSHAKYVCMYIGLCVYVYNYVYVCLPILGVSAREAFRSIRSGSSKYPPPSSKLLPASSLAS